MAVPYTRAEFEAHKARLRQIQLRDGGLFAGAAVALGFAQLGFIWWTDRHVHSILRVKIEGIVFLAYIALVAVLGWRMMRKLKAARPRCPQCGAALQEMSERVASATGRCDACGGQVIA